MVEQRGAARIIAVAVQHRLDEVERTHAAGNLGGVEISIEPESRFLGVQASRPIGQGQAPNGAPLVAGTDTSKRTKLWIRLGKALQGLLHLVGAVIMATVNAEHRGSSPAKSWGLWPRRALAPTVGRGRAARGMVAHGTGSGKRPLCQPH